MDAIEISFDCQFFSVDVLARTAHRYTADYFVELIAMPDCLQVRLIAKSLSPSDPMLAARFRNDALDDRLRAQIAECTAELQATLIRAALAEAWPSARSAE